MAARKKLPFAPKDAERKVRAKDQDVYLYADFLRSLLAGEIAPTALAESRDRLGRLTLEFEEKDK